MLHRLGIHVYYMDQYTVLVDFSIRCCSGIHPQYNQYCMNRNMNQEYLNKSHELSICLNH